MNKDFTIENIISYIKKSTGKVIDISTDRFDNSITFSYNGLNVMITQSIFNNTDNKHVCIHQLVDFSNRLINKLNIEK